MEDWERDKGVPMLCARTWGQLTRLFGDVADGVRVRLQFRTDVFGREVLLWGDFREWSVGDTGVLFVVVAFSFGDGGLSEDLRVPFFSVTDWVVE